MSQKTDRDLRAELESLQAQAQRLRASAAELDDAIFRSWSEAGALQNCARERVMRLGEVQARNRKLRLSLKEVWPLVTRVQVACVGFALVVFAVVVGSR